VSGAADASRSGDTAEGAERAGATAAAGRADED